MATPAMFPRYAFPKAVLALRLLLLEPLLNDQEGAGEAGWRDRAKGRAAMEAQEEY